MSRHEFQVRYSPEQVRRTTWAYVRITIARHFKWHDRLVALLVLVLWLWLVFEKPDTWMVWAPPLVLGCFALFLAILWTSYIRNQRERLSQMKSPIANMVVDDTMFSVSSDLGTTTMPWSAFTGVVDGSEAIYLKAGRSQFITLPTAGVDPAALDFIRERLRATTG